MESKHIIANLESTENLITELDALRADRIASLRKKAVQTRQCLDSIEARWLAFPNYEKTLAYYWRYYIELLSQYGADVYTADNSCKCGAYQDGPHTHCAHCANTTNANGVCKRASEDGICPDVKHGYSALNF